MIVTNRLDGTSCASKTDEFEPTTDWTGLLLKGGTDVSLAAPKGFGETSVSVDPYYEDSTYVGDRVTVQADQVRLDILVYRKQNRVRIALKKTGKPVWVPGRRG